MVNTIDCHLGRFAHDGRQNPPCEQDPAENSKPNRRIEIGAVGEKKATQSQAHAVLIDPQIESSRPQDTDKIAKVDQMITLG